MKGKIGKEEGRRMVGRWFIRLWRETIWCAAPKN